MKDRLFALITKHRKRLAGLTLVVFVLVVALDIGHVVPRATSLRLDIGDDHAAYTDVQITYVEGDSDGPVVRSARRHYEDGAPSRIDDSIDLVPGDYRVQLELTRRDGALERREGRFEAPGEGTIAVSWQAE